MLNVPEALPMSAGATAVITTLCVGGMATDTPEPASISGTIMSA
jgi:hypothetical protein